MTDLVRPLEHPALRAYLNDVVAWHGYIRFLGLPTFQDKTDVGIGELFVAPALSAQRISPDSEPEGWPATESVLDVLSRESRVVVLGDPGSGKSTLINWLAWRLAAGLSDRLPAQFDRLLPLPLVLRELDLGRLQGFDDLLRAFIRRPVAEALAGQTDLLFDYLEAGQVLLLLDGIDEVPLETRRALQKAVWEGWSRYPGLHCVATSRLIGYEECPFDARAGKGARDEALRGQPPFDELPATMMQMLRGERRSALVHVAPFDDRRIETFVANWYRARVLSEREAAEESARLLAALRSGDGTWRLARTPNLLTIMALVFRVKVRLPDGRGLLYENIAQAYLESIDQSRGFKDQYPWQEKRRWLARIGFEMQHRRSKTETEDEDSLLASEAAVLGWISKAMQHSSYDASESFAREYLQWIARRSGLLLPRGEGRYAFLHLSFQEYFAAVYLLDQIKGPDWASLPDEGAKRSSAGIDARISKQRLREWADDPVWREVLVFAFELLGQEPRWADKLAEWIYGAGFATAAASRAKRQTPPQRVLLLARLLVNPHSGLSAPVRDQAWKRCWRYALATGWIGTDESDQIAWQWESQALMSSLFGSELGRDRVLAALRDLPVRALSLTRTQVSDIAPWVEATPNLRELHAMGCPLRDVEPLTRLRHLETLTVDLSAAQSVEPMRRLSALHDLMVVAAPAGQELSWLVNAGALHTLYLSDGDLKTLEGIQRCTALTSLQLSNVPVENLTALSALTNLVRVELYQLPELDLAPLAALPRLRTVVAYRTRVKNDQLLRERGVKLEVFGERD